MVSLAEFAQPGDKKAALLPLHDTIENFIAAIPKKGALIGLDLGTKTIGIATSDDTMTIATAVDTLKRKKFQADFAALKEIVDTRGAIALIVGLPINMDGSEGPRAQSTRAFVRNVLKQMDMDVFFWDERLSTVAVTRTLLEADSSRAKRAESVDKLAAAYILQGFLDRKRNLDATTE